MLTNIVNKWQNISFSNGACPKKKSCWTPKCSMGSIHINNDMSINIHIHINMNIDITPCTPCRGRPQTILISIWILIFISLLIWTSSIMLIKIHYYQSVRNDPRIILVAWQRTWTIQVEHYVLRFFSSICICFLCY